MAPSMWILCLFLEVGLYCLQITYAGTISDLQSRCPSGYFGFKCRFRCHCRSTEICDKTSGTCLSGCASGYWGPGCQLSNNCYYNGQRQAYMGTKSITKSLYPCQRWDMQEPHRHKYDVGQFPDSIIPENYCRTTADSNQPWCYTTDGRKRWEHCNIDNCKCPTGRYGKNCGLECHCREAGESCASIMGSCQSGCALGWRDYDCKTATVCPLNLYGWDCSQRCYCQDARDCDRFTGPKSSCTCKDGYFHPPYCEPVTSPNVLRFSNTRVNPGQMTTFNCTISAFPVPNESEIRLITPPGKLVTLLRSRTLGQYIYTRINLFQVNNVNNGERYTCVVRATAGTASRQIAVDLFELPRLSKAPNVVANGLQATNVTIEWPPWSKEGGDTGDPPVEWYSVWVRAAGESVHRRSGTLYDKFCGDRCRYTIRELKPNTEFYIYIQTKRHGEHGGGPKGPTLTIKTMCSAPDLGVTVDSLTSEPLVNQSHPKARITVSWKDPLHDTWNCEEIVRYFLHISSTNPDIPASLIPIPGSSSKLISIPNLKPFTWYCIKIRFQTDETFFSPDSNTKCVRTPETVPTSPRNLALRRRTSNSLTITWNSPTSIHGNVTGYRILYWDKTNTINVLEVPALSTKMEYTIGFLNAYTPYSIQVQPTNSAGVGERSQMLYVLTEESYPGPVSSFRNVTRTHDTLRLQWDPPVLSNGATLYYTAACDPIRGIGNTFMVKKPKRIEVKLPPNTYEHLFRSMDSATQYRCTINATNSKGSGSSAYIVVWTEGNDPITPERPTVIERTENTITINLRPVEDKTVRFYRIMVEKIIVSNRKRRNVPPNIAQTTANYQTARANGKLVYIAAQLEKEDVGGAFTVGNNKTYDGYYNAPLEQDHAYNIWFVAYSTVDGAYSQSFSKTEGPVSVRSVASAPKSNHVPIIIGVLVVFILLVLAFAVMLIIWRKRHLNAENEKSDIQSFGPTILPEPDISPPLTPIGLSDNFEVEPLLESKTADMLDSEPLYGNIGVTVSSIKIEDLWDYVKQNKENDLDGFKREYKLIPAGLTAKCNIAKKTENRPKNRYGNIIAYDHTRVVLDTLDGDMHDDYINANYIDGYERTRAYIAAQGPNKATISDIWRMVWQENSRTVIMLTNTTETGKRKCDQYWPDEGFEEHRGMTVQLTSVDNLPDFTIRTFLLSKNSESKIVKQFHYTTWPDHGVPKFANSLILFRQKIRAYDSFEGGPVIVHCSAGVGRTGTYIAVDVEMEQAKHEGIIDTHNFVQLMRTQRVNMVQTLEQYVFVYDVLLEALLCGDSLVPFDTFRAAFTRLCQFDTAIGKTKLEEQFEIMRLISATVDKDETTTALRPENIFKNRCKNITPANRCRPYLTTPVDEGNDYINAVFLNSYRIKDAYIVTQMPLPDTVIDFWRMIYDHNCTCIVMLNDLDPNDESCEMYWTMDTCGESYGPFIIETTAEIKSDPSITVRDFTVTNTSNPHEIPRVIRQFQFHRWAENANCPSSKIALLELLDMVEKWQRQSDNRAVTVHCMNGASRSGLFCAVSTVLERIRADREVDVFQAVKQIRLNRPQLVDNMEQFKYCHEVIQDYRSSSYSLSIFT